MGKKGMKMTRPTERKEIAATANELVSVNFEVSLAPITETEYLSDHVESKLRTLEQRRAMKRLLRGLQHQGAATKDGRPVQRPGEVLRWLLEQIADGCPG